ncbi:germination protein GerPA [Pullulanibacillus camelliae]|uniref:Germination protein GerPA n=1 Tax=Pullulanibacillus camelliae TaxID=1707096 RepID=A0A8J2VMU3_9BACL|nr:spore germination protein [Pullulanibacillus camelliae]GGE39203.1 germination protein GerPA [Pullulanibacillus camelliae]
MPAIVGAVQVVNISSSGTFNIGDVYRIEPYSATKTYAGAGSFNTGDFIRTTTTNNQTQVLDSDVADMNQLLNV